MKFDIKQDLIVVLHAFFVWAACGAVIAVGRGLAPLDAVLVAHAVAAPLFAALAALVYFKRFNHCSPLKTASIFMLFALAMDAGLVAPFLEKSYDMFGSVLGTWVPLLSIFSAAYLTGMGVRNRCKASWRDIKFIFAPVGVAIGISVFVMASAFIVEKARWLELGNLLWFAPPYAVRMAGIALILLFLPLFLAGIYFLKRRGAVGQSETLVTGGVYRYTRNPMYAGISFTIIGLGLAFYQSALVLAGMIWFLLSLIQCRREERELEARFGREYADYKSKTPMFIPNIGLLLEDLSAKRG